MQHYDIIGDIHGHAKELKMLLEKMDYAKKDGVYQHASRKAVFLGDVIDRGPHQIETYRIVRNMCEAGSAQAILGNHEFNAVCWYTVDKNGWPLREHTPERMKQHDKLLTAVDGHPGLHQELIEWFKTLPLWLDKPGFFCVHAFPSVPHIAVLKTLTTDGVLLPDAWQRVGRKGSPEYLAAEIVLKGDEFALPHPVFFKDKDGHIRTQARKSFWAGKNLTTHDGLMDIDDIRHLLPLHTLAIPELVTGKPVFFGHYWIGDKPFLTSPRYACLDFSVAKGGHLVAYRWSGEVELASANLISVPCVSGSAH
jgi:hypothetical protein